MPSSYKGDKRTARQIIADEKLGKINQRFPSLLKDSTFDEIDAAAKRGDEDAITARKLLTDGRFSKGRRSLRIVDSESSLGGHIMTSNVDTQLPTQLFSGPEDSKQQIVALYQAASNAVGLRQDEQAVNFYQQALSVAQQKNDAEEMAWSLDRIATIYSYNLKDVEQGIAYFNQALKVAEQTGNEALLSMYQSELGAAYQQAGQHERAIKCYAQALNLARSAHDKTREGSSLADLGSAYQAQGKLEEAIAFYRQAFALFEQSGDNKEAASLIADDLAETYEALGDKENAAYYRRREAEYDKVIFA